MAIKFWKTIMQLVCAFSALTLLVGRQEVHPPVKNMEWWGAGVVICLERDANDLHIVQLMLLPPCHFSKIQNGLFFWYRPTQVVLYKRPLNGCVCVCYAVGWNVLRLWISPWTFLSANYCGNDVAVAKSDHLTAVINIHFTSATPHVKCNNIVDTQIIYY